MRQRHHGKTLSQHSCEVAERASWYVVCALLTEMLVQTGRESMYNKSKLLDGRMCFCFYLCAERAQNDTGYSEDTDVCMNKGLSHLPH